MIVRVHGKEIETDTIKRRRNLIDFFGARCLLKEINEGKADEWRLYLIEQKLAEATVRKGLLKKKAENVTHHPTQYTTAIVLKAAVVLSRK